MRGKTMAGISFGYNLNMYYQGGYGAYASGYAGGQGAVGTLPGNQPENSAKVAEMTGRGEDSGKVAGKSTPQECQTCKERKYQDGSDENVSFKAAAHIAPGAAGAVVRAHEGEHVSNAYTKAAKAGGQVVSASVSIHTGVCPECGRTYVAGGTTRTTIKYPNESNPYQKARKAQDALKLRGNNINYAA